MRNPIFPLAIAPIFATPLAKAGDPEGERCRKERIAAILQQALSKRHATGRKKGAAARAAYDTLKPAVDGGCFAAADDETTLSNAAPPEAIAYAWLPYDASTCLIAAGSDDDAQLDTGSPARLDVPHQLIRDDLRPRVAAISLALRRRYERSAMQHALRWGLVQADQRGRLAGLSQPSCAVHGIRRVESILASFS